MNPIEYFVWTLAASIPVFVIWLLVAGWREEKRERKEE